MPSSVALQCQSFIFFLKIFFQSSIWSLFYFCHPMRNVPYLTPVTCPSLKVEQISATPLRCKIEKMIGPSVRYLKKQLGTNFEKWFNSNAVGKDQCIPSDLINFLGIHFGCSSTAKKKYFQRLKDHNLRKTFPCILCIFSVESIIFNSIKNDSLELCIYKIIIEIVFEILLS